MSSATDLRSSLRITLARWASTVRMLMPSSEAIAFDVLRPEPPGARY